MSNQKNNDVFFKWFVSLFKKRKPVVQPIVEPTEEEIAKEKKWNETKAKYSLERIDSHNCYFVRYLYKNEWWYLRKWQDEGYTLQRVRGNCMRIDNIDQLESVIFFHQSWISEGHIHMPINE